MAKDEMTIEEFIRKEGKLISKPEIERRLGMPTKTLQRVNDGRKVPEKFRMDLITFFKSMGDDISFK